MAKRTTPDQIPSALSKSSLLFEQSVRGVLGSGSPLRGRLREALERWFGISLGSVRVHHGGAADTLARALDAKAFTVGTDIFFRRDAYDPDSPAGIELLAHEIAHVRQSARHPRGPVAAGIVVDPDVGEEIEATIHGWAFRNGWRCSAPLGCKTARPTGDGALVVRRHASWEHRMLGDVKTYEGLVGNSASRTAYLQQLQNFLFLWAKNPDVPAEAINQYFPDIRTVRLHRSGVLATYGELNTLADYLATPVDLDTLPRNVLIPILQQVRQEGWAWAYYLKTTATGFPDVGVGYFTDSISATVGNDTADTLWGTLRMDNHTDGLGPHGTDHYTAVVGRNACHFAPHSWYRWEEFYLQSREYATEAYHARDVTRKERLENLAWVYHGYADHYLHDSFAAGHLINKSLIMQWFIEWVAKTANPVPAWDLVKNITATLQPSLSASQLYAAFNDPSQRGPVRDPQTMNEHWSQAKRIQVSGVAGPAGGLDAYQRYLAFLDNSVVQLASGAVHDYFNKQSLFVSSVHEARPYQVYGDNTMIQGGTGYLKASEAAQLSQRSILEMLDSGRTAIFKDDIFTRFPTAVHPDSSAPGLSLVNWHTDSTRGFRKQAEQQFGGIISAAVGFASPQIEKITVDRIGGWRFVKIPGEAIDIAVGGDGSAWCLQKAATDGGNGQVAKWDPSSGTFKAGTGAGVKIAVDAVGAVLVVNKDGACYRKEPNEAAWKKLAGQLADIAAGADGSVFCIGVGDTPRVYRYASDGKWEPVAEVPKPGRPVAISVSPVGMPWVVTDTGSVFRMTPGPNERRMTAEGGASWTDASPKEGKAVDVGVALGSFPWSWLTTNDHGILAWNGRSSAPSQTPSPASTDWERMGGGAVRVATGPDGRAWFVNKAKSIYRIEPADQSTVEFSTHDAGKVIGTATIVNAALFPGQMVSVNGSTDLSRVMKGDAGARVNWIKMEYTHGGWRAAYRYRVTLNGQGPSGTLGSMYLYFYGSDKKTYFDYKAFRLGTSGQTLTMDYNADAPEIHEIRWSNDPWSVPGGK